MKDARPIVLMLRAQAWQRVKGELRALCETFVSDEEKEAERVEKLMTKFFKDIQDDAPWL